MRLRSTTCFDKCALHAETRAKARQTRAKTRQTRANDRHHAHTLSYSTTRTSVIGIKGPMHRVASPGRERWKAFGPDQSIANNARKFAPMSKPWWVLCRRTRAHRAREPCSTRLWRFETRGIRPRPRPRRAFLSANDAKERTGRTGNRFESEVNGGGNRWGVRKRPRGSKGF